MGKQIRYTSEYKLQTVQIYLQGDVSATQLATNLGIHPHTVRHWIRDYNDGKMTDIQLPGSSGNKLPPVTVSRQTECDRRPDIGVIISKINTMEADLRELKSTLKEYLFL